MTPGFMSDRHVQYTVKHDQLSTDFLPPSPDDQGSVDIELLYLAFGQLSGPVLVSVSSLVTDISC